MLYNQVTITSLCEKDGHKEIGEKFSGITLDDSINNLISKLLEYVACAENK